MHTVTYEEVFGVELGKEVQESHGASYTPCPAVTSLREQLGTHTFFGAKLGGRGPLYRADGYKHEFNRHHAGLAVDIMLDPKSDGEVALGHHLVLLFKRLTDLMKWRGIIYQNVSINSAGHPTASVSVTCWTKGGHHNHIHIDWHSSGSVKWRYGITEIPLRRRDGTVIKMPLMDGDHIAESITWTPQAMTIFGTDSTLREELDDLMAKHSRGELKKLDLMSAVGLTKC